MYISCPRSRINYFSKELALFFNDTYHYLTLYYIFVCIWFLFLSPLTKLQVHKDRNFALFNAVSLAIEQCLAYSMCSVNIIESSSDHETSGLFSKNFNLPSRSSEYTTQHLLVWLLGVLDIIDIFP